MRRYRIATIPGDGIGPEVVSVAIDVLREVTRRHEVTLDFETFPWSCGYYAEHGRMMPPDGIEQLRTFDAIYLGAVGAPGVPDHVSLWGLLIPIRRAFDQYVNLRPVRLLPGVRSPIGDRAEGLDLVVVRENTEGEYSEVGGRLYRGTPDEMAIQEAVFTRRGVERIARYAFELAQTRRAVLTSATKSNGIVHTMPFWDEVVADVAVDYPDVEVHSYHIDALVALMVLDPTRFDVIVGSNLFGDILSDLAPALAGSIGIAPSANLDPTRRHPSMFEPVHGSAPDIVGTGRANPVGALWTGVQLLTHLGEQCAADELMAAIEATLADGTRTPDLGGTASTGDVARRVVAALGGPVAGTREG
jgi:tartrate dehydrogenase/decarboxylase/D-malate dehydrogenase